MNYYKNTAFVSNSDFSKLQRALAGQPDIKGGFLQFGSLVDALISEPELVDYVDKTIVDSAGEVFAFTQADWDKAQRMKRSALNHPLVRLLVQNMEFQCEKYIDNFLIESDTASFYLPVKCKYDGVNFEQKLGLDLKTTAAATLKAFKESIMMFHYHRQAAFYMDLGELDRFVIVGISKQQNKKGEHDVFIQAIERGDELYLKGRAEYQKFALLYDMLIFKNN